VRSDCLPHPLNVKQRPKGIRRGPPTAVPDGSRLQHEFRHPRLSGRRRELEAHAARPLSGIHRGRCHPASLLGTQHDRLASLRASAAQRCPSRPGSAGGQRSQPNAAHPQRGPAAPGGWEQGGHRFSTDASIWCAAWRVRPPLRRAKFQDDPTRLNAAWTNLEAASLPDGDAEIDQADFSGFIVPDCQSCGGTIKPDIVFFGQNVPWGQVDKAKETTSINWGNDLDSVQHLAAGPSNGSQEWLDDFLNHLGQDETQWNPNASMRVRPMSLNI